MRSVAESGKKDMAISFCFSAALRAVGGICTKLSGLRTFRSMCPRYDKCQQAEWDGTNVRLARGGWGSGEVGWVKGSVVVCPAALVSNWSEEFGMWLGKDFQIVECPGV
jgi:hypothetical protein